MHGTSMDPLLETLRSLHFTGGVFLDAAFRAPWCVLSQVEPEDCGPHQPPPPQVVAYHYVTEGALFLQVGRDTPVHVTAGHIVVLPRNDPHRIGSDLSQPPLAAGALMRPGEADGLSRIDASGAGAVTRILCGYLGTEAPAGPVLDALPTALAIDVADGVAAAWIESSLRFAAQQCAPGGHVSPSSLGALAELLFMEAARRYVASLPPEETTWLFGMRDPLVGRALTLLHERPAHAWTTPLLAREVGASRSVLAERFVKVMGEPPMRYLTRQRLHRAGRRLRETGDTVARIAFDTGYESEAAFTRAFRRAFGLPPGAWRRTAREGTSHAGSA
jgi:AraC-like DNA-binding protein